MTRQLDEFKKFIREIDDRSEWRNNINRHCILRSELEFCGDAILFVGPTKSGKSTLINCLLGNTLKCIFDGATEEWHLENLIDGSSPNNRQPKITALGQSETLWPMLYKTRRGVNLWDMPGLNDNRGVKHEIKESAMSRIVITSHQAVSFVLVIPESLAEQTNQLPLVELINTLSQYSRYIEEHLFIVISKTNKDWKILLRKVLDWIPGEDNTNTRLIERAKEIVRAVITRNAGFSFKMPEYDDENSEHEYRFPNPDLIFKLHNVDKIHFPTCPYVLSSEAKLYLNTQQGILNSVIKTNLQKICAFYEIESKSRVAIISQNPCSKEERIDRIFVARNNLIKKIEFLAFLNFVMNNTSAPRDALFFGLINDLKSDHKILLKCNEILGCDTIAQLLQLAQSAVNRVAKDMEATIMKLHDENSPSSSSSSSCIIS